MDALALLDWRRRVTRLYADIRTSPDPRAAHDLWRRTRDDLLGGHPESPLPAQDREGFAGLPVAPYDPEFRFDVAVETGIEPAHLEVMTGTDGLVRFDRIGFVDMGSLGRLDVWWLGAYGGGVFVPIRDGLAGTETYGGGRYVIDTVKSADLGGEDGGRVIA